MIGTVKSLARFALPILGAVLVTAPAHADEKVFVGIRYTTIEHEWTVNRWKIWALPDHRCVAILQEASATPFNFWGFRVDNGLEVQMFFGSVPDPRPQTVQISYNGGPPVSYAAGVEPFLEWNAYVVPIKLEDLWALPDDLSFNVYAGGNKIIWDETAVMGKVAEALEKCDNWQDKH